MFPKAKASLTNAIEAGVKIAFGTYAPASATAATPKSSRCWSVAG